jgi:hypothetical protein
MQAAITPATALFYRGSVVQALRECLAISIQGVARAGIHCLIDDAGYALAAN